MYIRYVCFPVLTLGPGKRLGIWVSGCSKVCAGCMSPELRNRRDSDRVSLKTLQGMISDNSRAIEGVTISGGEPFDQIDELAALTAFLSENVCEDILVYTGYTFEEIRDMPGATCVLDRIATLVDGVYIESLDDGEGLRGSANQRTIRVKQGFDFDYEHVKRAQQLFSFDGGVLAIGLRRRHG